MNKLYIHCIYIYIYGQNTYLFSSLNTPLQLLSALIYPCGSDMWSNAQLIFKYSKPVKTNIYPILYFKFNCVCVLVVLEKVLTQRI